MNAPKAIEDLRAAVAVSNVAFDVAAKHARETADAFYGAANIASVLGIPTDSLTDLAEGYLTMAKHLEGMSALARKHIP